MHRKGASGMNLTVNGEALEAPDDCTVSELLAQLKVNGTVAVERNGELVRRVDQSTTRLTEADQVEIVHFVGGG